jgi:hypothetical protein
MRFLNCNYPNKCTIPPGKPKQLKKTRFSMTLDGVTLIEEKKDTIWFVLYRKYYYGVELDIKYNRLKQIDIFGTVGAVNIELLNWTGETLGNTEEDLLYKYLKLIC